MSSKPNKKIKLSEENDKIKVKVKVKDEVIKKLQEHEEKFNIDRDQENKDVVEYQKTKDERILEKIYKARIPTLQFWAKQHYYPGLMFSEKEMFDELHVTFMKAVHGYKKNRGSFNTCLFTFLLNRIKNIKNAKHAKKRTSDIYQGPANGLVLSLEYSYGTNEDEQEVTLKDMLAEDLYGENSAPITMNMEDTISVLANGNEDISEFLVQISEGRSIASIIREYKTRKGRLKIKNVDKVTDNIVKSLIKEKIKEEFTLIDYAVKSNHVEYKIEMKKNEKAEMVLKKIREFKSNKDYYLGKLDKTI